MNWTMQWVAVGTVTKKIGIMLVLAMTVSLAHAFSGPNQTNTFDGVVTNFSGNYGGGSWADVMIVRNGGKLFVTGAGFVGAWAVDQSNNVAYISDAGSVWSNSSYMIVGGGGKGNQMTITNGGFVTSAGGATIGHGSDNNTVLVTGTGSVWSNDITIGLSGAGNLLTIGNSGKVYGAINSIGTGSATVDASNNTVLVTGAGSVWSGTGLLTIGSKGTGNQLTISNGGAVYGTSATIGTTSNNNTVLVTGAGSVWSNSAALTIGSVGAGNGLSIANGGTVYSLGSCTLGSTAASSNNTVLVTGAGSFLTNNSNLNVGGSGSGNHLTITNGGTVTSSGDSSIGWIAGSSNNAVWVTGMGSVWTNLSSSICVGNQGTRNQLVITNGGKVYSPFSFTIGSALTSSSNAVLVTGTGSVWISTLNLTVGSQGAGNQLTIANGGAVFNAAGVLGDSVSSSNNTVLVTGAGSLWTNTTLTLGKGLGNQLTIAGGQVIATTVSLTTNNNTILVTGGILDTTSMGIDAGRAGTVISNSGGIFQFSVSAPTITPSIGVIAVNGGTVSFRDIHTDPLPNLTNNWVASSIGLMAWSGTNTLRLNNSLATNSLANSYIFYAGNGPTNYAGLELINGTNVVKGKGITIDSTGSLLVSNTLATFVGVVTNNSSKVNLAGPSTITASNGIVWAAGSAATTTAGTVTFDDYTSNRFDSGTVTLCQSAATATQIVNGVVWGPGSLLKSGPGVLILAASNLYTGATTISNGTLLVNGSVTGAVTVVSGAKLGGVGTVYGAVTNSGTFTAAITNNPVGATVLNVHGNLVLQPGSQLILTGTNYLVGSSGSYTIIQTTGGSVSGTFANDTAILPRGWRISYSGTTVKVAPGYPGTLFMIQ